MLKQMFKRWTHAIPHQDSWTYVQQFLYYEIQFSENLHLTYETYTLLDYFPHIPDKKGRNALNANK